MLLDHFGSTGGYVITNNYNNYNNHNPLPPSSIFRNLIPDEKLIINKEGPNVHSPFCSGQHYSFPKVWRFSTITHRPSLTDITSVYPSKVCELPSLWTNACSNKEDIIIMDPWKCLLPRWWVEAWLWMQKSNHSSYGSMLHYYLDKNRRLMVQYVNERK